MTYHSVPLEVMFHQHVTWSLRESEYYNRREIINTKKDESVNKASWKRTDLSFTSDNDWIEKKILRPLHNDNDCVDRFHQNEKFRFAMLC